jgi:hypothetical protein
LGLRRHQRRPRPPQLHLHIAHTTPQQTDCMRQSPTFTGILDRRKRARRCI